MKEGGALLDGRDSCQGSEFFLLVGIAFLAMVVLDWGQIVGCFYLLVQPPFHKDMARASKHLSVLVWKYSAVLGSGWRLIVTWSCLEILVLVSTRALENCC